ncbi:HAMP domain-containing sensor histidine kinase [Sphingomonas sp. MJ1 (PH-R8)]|uniref:sensor histidine kinase n=1 Tax=Sphingomonas sp. MJ1 (PH-R8) TaxID=3112950 RepID=UPI003A85114E
MIGAAKAWVRRHWPRLSLRTYLFASFFLVAALPGVGAVFLRVYENTLVRQTEAELAAQGAALAASAAAMWPGTSSTLPARAPVMGRRPYEAAGSTEVDLSSTPILPERPAPVPAWPPTADAQAAAARFAPVLGQTREATLASILLLDRQGRLVTGSKAGGSYAALPEVTSALDGRPATTLRRNGAYRAVYRFEWLSRAAAIRVHHARPIFVDGQVVGVLLLSRSARALFVGLYEDRGKIAFGVLAILGALIVLSGLLSRGIARPIDQLRQAARGVAAGQGSVPAVPPTAAIEIQDLYRDFAVMAEAIDKRSRYLRDFAHAVSHEFKTPLAAIRGAIELLQDHADDMGPEDRRRFLANVDADAMRLTLLVSRLLELARADMMTAASDGIADVVATARRLADALGSAECAIAVEVETPVPAAAMPQATLEAVLATLLDNSRQAGASAITIDVRQEQDLLVTVTDNGSGIPRADRGRIFEPFFTSRRARGGTGLGLPIARSLLASAGGELELLDTPSGTAFRLTLPALP